MAEISQKDIEFLFQEEVLSQHGEFLIDLLTETLEEKNIRVTDDLLESLNYQVSRRGQDRILKVNFFEYGRFIEIRKHKTKKQNRMDVNTNRLLWGVKENKLKKKKDTDWYSRNAYGSLNRLISILMNELSKEEITRLKGILENRVNLPL
jgi:hypothetical protein